MRAVSRGVRTPGGGLAEGPLPGGSGSSRPVRGRCTLEDASRVGQLGVFRVIQGFF